MNEQPPADSPPIMSTWRLRPVIDCAKLFVTRPIEEEMDGETHCRYWIWFDLREGEVMVCIAEVVRTRDLLESRSAISLCPALPSSASGQ